MESSLTGNGTTHIYYNVNITNNDTTGLSKPPQVSFIETRIIDLIGACNNSPIVLYFLLVILVLLSIYYLIMLQYVYINLL
jgi:hypothetical protein